MEWAPSEPSGLETGAAGGECAAAAALGSGVKPAGVNAVAGGVPAGAGATLGSARKPGGTVGIVAGDGVGSTSVTVVKMLAKCWIAATSCWIAATWPSLAGESGEASDGCWRAVPRSRAAVIARSVEDTLCMAT
jgi:hypothetical protein